MGWASGGAIFDRVAHALIEANASDEVKRNCLGPLIDALQEGDWDTEYESAEEFANDPAIVALFAERGIVDIDDEDDDPPELIQRRERERVGLALLDRFQAMREAGDSDMRTVMQQVRDVTGLPA